MLKLQNKKSISQAEFNEMMDLCVAWIGVLFRRLGVGTYSISMKDISEGLGKLQFSAVREGNEYIITLTAPEGSEEANVGYDT